MADVSLPGVGPVSKKWLVIVVGASAVTVGYIVIRKRSQASSAASTATDTTAADGGTIDPLTGDIAGSAQDQADLASMQDGGYGNSLGIDGTGAYGYGGGEVSPVPVGTQLPGAGGFTTNGEWAQQAEADLGGLGIDPVTLSAALGAYLTGRSLTADQESLVNQAIAEEGYPPVSGPGGYPPAMRTGGGTSGGGGGTGGGTKKPAAPKAHVSHIDQRQATITWGKVTGAASYGVQRSGAGRDDVGTATEHTFGDLKPKTHYTYHVWAKNSAGSSPAATGTFTTK